MKLVKILHFFVAVAAIGLIKTQISPSYDNGNEHKCYSRFDYESKMLERIVMVEHRMNLMEASTKQTLVKIVKEKDSMIAEMKQTLKSMMSQQNESLAEMKTDLKTQIDALRDEQTTQMSKLLESGDELKNTSQRLIEEQKDTVNQMKIELFNVTNNIKEDIVDTKSDMLRKVTVFYSSIAENVTEKVGELTDVQTNLQTLSSELKDEQNTKLEAFKLVGEAIASDIRTRMTLLEYEKAQQELEYKNSLLEFNKVINQTWIQIQREGFGIEPQIAFHVQNTKDGFADDIVVFQEEVVNTQSIYNTKDGKFTVPVDGVYIFSVQMCGGIQENVNFKIVSGSKILSESSMYDYDTDTSCVSTTAIALLTKGEEVFVESGELGLYMNNSVAKCAFMGALIN